MRVLFCATRTKWQVCCSSPCTQYWISFYGLKVVTFSAFEIDNVRLMDMSILEKEQALPTPSAASKGMN